MTPQHMQSARDRIARQTKAFLRRGGRIETIPAGWEPKPEEPEHNWISTIEAAKIIGVSYHKLLQWRATNASCPRNRKEGRSVEWFRPSVEAFSAEYKGKRNGRKV